jgi:hypothetical protein
VATELEIVNLALSRVGDLRISAYPAVAADGKAGRAVNAAWPTVRDEVLRAHSWNFATKRDRLTWTQKTITGITQAASAVVSSAAHGLTTGTFVRFDGVAGMAQMNGLVGKITAAPANTFTVDIDSTLFSAYTSGGTATVVPAFEWGNLYALPADCIRVLDIDGADEGEEWAVEQRNLVTDLESPVLIRYVYQNLDEASWDAHFVSAAAARLAVALVEELAQSPGKRQMLWEEYQLLLGQARRSDGREQTASDFVEDEWITVRG